MQNLVSISFRIERIPSFEVIASRAKKRWGKEVGGVTPSYFPKSGDELVIFKPAIGKKLNLHQNYLYIKDLNMKPANVFGLVLLEDKIISRNVLPEIFRRQTWFLSFDELHNLYFKSPHGHLLPYLQAGEGIDPRHCWHPYREGKDSPYPDHDDALIAIKPS